LTCWKGFHLKSWLKLQQLNLAYWRTFFLLIIQLVIRGLSYRLIKVLKYHNQIQSQILIAAWLFFAYLLDCSGKLMKVLLTITLWTSMLKPNPFSGSAVPSDSYQSPPFWAQVSSDHFWSQKSNLEFLKGLTIYFSDHLFEKFKPN